jgi:hypothetical protein
MKTVALIALLTGIAAAVAGIILQSIKIHKAGKSDKWTTGTIVFAVVFIIISVVNLILVIPNL